MLAFLILFFSFHFSFFIFPVGRLCDQTILWSIKVYMVWGKVSEVYFASGAWQGNSRQFFLLLFLSSSRSSLCRKFLQSCEYCSTGQFIGGCLSLGWGLRYYASSYLIYFFRALLPIRFGSCEGFGVASGEDVHMRVLCLLVGIPKTSHAFAYGTSPDHTCGCTCYPTVRRDRNNSLSGLDCSTVLYARRTILCTFSFLTRNSYSCRPTHVILTHFIIERSRNQFKRVIRTFSAHDIKTSAVS